MTGKARRLRVFAYRFGIHTVDYPDGPEGRSSPHTPLRTCHPKVMAFQISQAGRFRQTHPFLVDYFINAGCGMIGHVQ